MLIQTFAIFFPLKVCCICSYFSIAVLKKSTARRTRSFLMASVMFSVTWFAMTTALFRRPTNGREAKLMVQTGVNAQMAVVTAPPTSTSPVRVSRNAPDRLKSVMTARGKGSSSLSNSIVELPWCGGGG